MKKKKRQKLSLSDRLILNSGYILLGIFLLAIIVPLIYVIVASFMDPVVLSSEGITFDFSKWSLEGYSNISCSNINGSISIIKRRVCWKKICKYIICDNYVFRWWINTNIFIDR